MEELLRHFIVFFTLFIFIRLKVKRYIIASFILLPFIGEVIQLIPQLSIFNFQFEWSDVLINYSSALFGWTSIAAIREHQKIKYNSYRSLINYERKLR